MSAPAPPAGLVEAAGGGLAGGAAASAAAGAALILVSLALVPACVALARRLSPERHAFVAPWGFPHLLLVAAVAFAAAGATPFLWPVEPGEADAVDMLGSLMLLLGATALACVEVARRTAPGGARGLGLTAAGSVRGALTGVACYLVLLPGVLGLGLAWPFVLEAFGGEFRVQDVLEELRALSGAALAAALVLAVVVGPFLEELIFRGFLQPLLVGRLGGKGGVAATSLLFATLHGLSAFGPVFGLSLLLGALMLRTHRLSAAWAAHALHNGVVLAFALLVPGSEELLKP